jgi:hypothetical protein
LRETITGAPQPANSFKSCLFSGDATQTTCSFPANKQNGICQLLKFMQCLHDAPTFLRPSGIFDCPFSSVEKEEHVRNPLSKTLL